MKSILQSALALGAVFAATTGAVFAAPGLNVPEPGSLALVGVAVAALIYVSRKGKK